MQPLVELKKVTFGYGERAVLEGVDLHLHPGTICCFGWAKRCWEVYLN